MSVIRQKEKSEDGGNKTLNHVKFSEKRTFLNPWYVHVRVRIRGVTNVGFSENLACFCILVTSVLRFALLSSYRRTMNLLAEFCPKKWISKKKLHEHVFFPKLSGIKVIFNYPETQLKITQELNTKKYHFSRITKFHLYSISHLFRCILHFSKISSLNGCLKKVQNPNFFEVEKRFIDRFYAIGLFLYPLRFSDVFRGYRKRPVIWNGLSHIYEFAQFNLHLLSKNLYM